MAGKTQANTDPVPNPEATPAPLDRIRINLTTSEVATIANGKLTKVAGIKAEIYLPKPGKVGAPKPDEEFFGNNAGEVLLFLAQYAENRTLDQFGIKIRTGEPSANGAQ